MGIQISYHETTMSHHRTQNVELEFEIRIVKLQCRIVKPYCRSVDVKDQNSELEFDIPLTRYN